MNPLDLVYYVFWWGVGIAILVLLVLPIASVMFTVALTFLALQVGLALAIVGYIAGIPWAIYRRVVDGAWPDGG